MFPFEVMLLFKGNLFYLCVYVQIFLLDIIFKVNGLSLKLLCLLAHSNYRWHTRQLEALLAGRTASHDASYLPKFDVSISYYRHGH